MSFYPIRSKTKSWPPHKYVRKFHRRILDLRHWLTREIYIEDVETSYRFRCETVRELSRCFKIFTKEPGTLDWIMKNVHSGDVFYDIGANIGVFTILAAFRAGSKGKVYAFEPHGANFARLIENITVNNLQQNVIPCNFALHEKEGFYSFGYSSNKAGTSNSQLESSDPNGVKFQSEISELKYAATIDGLIALRKIEAPNHIKIDVDGNELLILRGMQELLNKTSRPRTIQVEMNTLSGSEIREFLETRKYRMEKEHYTRAGKRRLAEGVNASEIGFNAIFLAGS